MTGDQLAKEILLIKPDIPIIICTGFSERITKEKAEAIGIKGFLMKPIVRSDIAHEVRKVLDACVKANKRLKNETEITRPGSAGGPPALPRYRK
jgi:FixJ family two-component response regulator